MLASVKEREDVMSACLEIEDIAAAPITTAKRTRPAPLSLWVSLVRLWLARLLVWIVKTLKL